jgi:hypothetical protein
MYFSPLPCIGRTLPRKHTSRKQFFCTINSIYKFRRYAISHGLQRLKQSSKDLSEVNAVNDSAEEIAENEEANSSQ